MNAQNYTNLCSTEFDFCKILKMRKKSYLIRELFYCTKKRCSQIEPQLKVELEDGRGAS